MNIKHQNGLSLIELMIALSLGVVISLFLINIMASSNRAAINSEGSSEATENGRFIAGWLTERFRIGGYSSEGTNLEIPYADTCAAANILPPAPNANCSFDDDNSTTTGGDKVVTLRTIDTSASDATYSSACDGTDLSGLPDGTVVADIFWVEQNINSINDDDFDDVLYCSTYNHTTGIQLSAAQVIANGIEGMQALYLEDNRPNGNETAPTIAGLEYRNASNVVNWERVSGLKFSILTRSFNDSTQNVLQRSYILLDAAPYTYSDRVVRNIQQTAVFPTNIDK
ncbi:PilW family protein [Bacterioplanoides sp.]|uniref:PilW family protein n=1 Tax=Bacterioplanoides sp. TaxID=2066072 RepID=UPI003B00099A